jgi:MYXO-CTERM domain-containing protein
MIAEMSGALDDPSEKAHDVLAAEEFAMPTLDPSLRHGPVTLPADPADPAGVTAPHDVLAAEEFPMPAPRPGRRMAVVAPPPGGPSPLPIGATVVVVLGLLLMRRRRRRAAAR